MGDLKIIDLCAGIGGMRKGFEMAGGFTNVFSAENDPMACKTYEANFGENPMGDVTDERITERIPPYDVLLAGFPCQTFSIAGQRQGFKDETRGTIFFYIADILEKTNPSAFLLENVEGLVRHDRGRTLRTILNVLRDQLGYKVDYKLLNAKDFGVPQNRPRVFIVGFRDHSVRFDFPEEGSKVYAKNIHEILEEEPVSPKFYLSQGYWETLQRHRQRHEGKGNGYGYIILDKEGISNAILATGGSGRERNLVIDERIDLDTAIVPTNKRTPLNRDYVRVLTPREWSRLQGFEYCFKDGFEIPVSDTAAYKQFGNAVAIPLVYEIALRMKEALLEARGTVRIPSEGAALNGASRGVPVCESNPEYPTPSPDPVPATVQG